MYKLIAIDLDGTLMNSQGQITDEDIEAIKKLKEAGSIVIINSGRQLETIKNIAQEIGNIDYCVCGNGALLYDLKNNKILFSQFLDKSKAIEIIKMCKASDIYFNIYTDKEILVESLKDNVLAFYYNNKTIPYAKQTRIKIEPDIEKYILNNECSILKIGMSNENEDIFQNGFEQLKKIKNIDILEVKGKSNRFYSDGDQEIEIEYFYTEATSVQVNKWTAIDKLASILEIKAKDIAAIGDNINDAAIIVNAGLGIAMGNATPYIHEIANVATLSNDRSGVAHAIYKYLLK